MKTNSDRITRRRQESQSEILDASWAVVREHGLAGLSMRDLGERVGMRAQSIYSYFASKHDIYDAMFLHGYRAFLDWMNEAASDEEFAAEPMAAARRSIHAFVAFCTNDPVRYQLLFQRTIPGFTPSPESYAVAMQAYEQMRTRLAAIGVKDQPTFDLWSAMMTGLTDQQISNDPGGDRWVQLIDRAVDLLLADVDISTGAHPNAESERA
ncbi:TetR/AcrR family transcriptional regulator [Ilumatobacter sp.]|uniref:TetR/AcrR family transcriptional regulator n=1 Tax=Ilumatobacter sp. TaxID=1967498 RepID=UPI003C6ECBE3